MKTNLNIHSSLTTFLLLYNCCLWIISCDINGNNTSPNIILIVSDDQGYNDIAAYGADDIITPNLDKLAEEGVRLTNFYVTSSVCTPSRSSLLTGRYPQRNGTYELFRNELPDVGHEYTDIEYSTTPERILGTDLKEIFISELLKDAGYANGIFGKWDLGQLNRFLPLQQGFHSFYGFANTGIDYFTHERYGVPSMFNDNHPTTADRGTYSTFLFEREAKQFLEQNKDQPFFLYLPFNAPHNASNLDPKIRSSVQAPVDYLNRYPQDTSIQQQKRRGYKAAITAMDYSIGNILDLIASYDLEEHTIVIFLSDNGGGMGSDNSPFSGGKSHFLEGGIRVPCIIKWPGELPEGTTNDAFLSSLEIFPTILAACNIEKPDNLILDGFNMLPVLIDSQPSPRNTMFWELRGGFAGRVNNFKLVNDMRGNNGFFNLETDQEEKIDLTDSLPLKFEMVKSKFKDWQKLMSEAEHRGPFKNF